jgi:type VI secretion system Hcp family effector
MQLGAALGNVTEAAHKGQIEVIETRWSTVREVRSAVGTNKDRNSSSAYVSELKFVKPIDSASFYITQNAFGGQALKCVIDYTRTDKGKEAVWRTITLTDAMITSLVNETPTTGEGREEVSLNFTIIEVSDQTSGSKSTTEGGPFKITYDLGQAEAQ